MKSIKEWREKRLQNKLGQAIIKHDIKSIGKALEAGATSVDLTQSVVTGYGHVPALRVFDPVELAKKVGLPQEGVDLLQKHLRDHHAKPSVDLLKKPGF